MVQQAFAVEPLVEHDCKLLIESWNVPKLYSDSCLTTYDAFNRLQALKRKGDETSKERMHLFFADDHSLGNLKIERQSTPSIGAMQKIDMLRRKNRDSLIA